MVKGILLRFFEAGILWEFIPPAYAEGYLTLSLRDIYKLNTFQVEGVFFTNEAIVSKKQE
jgi:hypothetical protein